MQPKVVEEHLLNGKSHRLNGPAVIYSDGTEMYFINGTLHREDGPAVIYGDGTETYFINGKVHREDGPAALYPDGTKKYFINGNLHREDGPAITYAGIIQDIEFHTYWYINGTEITSDVVNWLSVTGYKWPFNEQQLIEFKLRFCFNNY